MLFPFFVSSVVLCSHKKTFSEWCSVTMQHETLCRTPLALGILKRVHHSIPVTNHLPHGGGKVGRAASTAEIRLRHLKYNCMPGRKPPESPAFVFTHNFCLFRSFLHFLLVISCAESDSGISQFS